MVTEPWLVTGGTVIAVIGIGVLMLVWLWRVLILHRLATKSTPQCTLGESRFPPDVFNRLHLSLGISVLITAVLLFGFIANNVVSAGTLAIVDFEIAQWLHAHSTTMLTQCLLVITHLHDPLVLSPVAGMIALYCMWKKRRYAALVGLLVVQGGMLLNLLAKHAFQRTRPIFDDPLVTLATYSFPSGHVVASTVFYGVLAAWMIPERPSWPRIVCTFLIAFAMVFMVAFSRMYLGAHYLSDVLAAILEAMIWCMLCLTSIHLYRVYRETHKVNTQ